MDAMTRRIALKELRSLKAREAEYRQEVDDWYRAGDGRPPRYVTDPETGRTRNRGGKGYAFPYCQHGASQWTDYDNICGGCEDGYSVYELALFRAHDIAAEVNKRIEWLSSAPKSLPTEMHRDLIDWAIKVLD